MSVASNEAGKAVKKKDGAWETIKVVIQALLLALIVSTFVFRLFSIPSASMRVTLLEGDYVFVSKYAYGYSRYSFPFGLAPFDGRIFGHEPTRGDVVVFKLPSDNRTDYIKRLIGLPGDHIQMIDGVLYINGEAVQRERIEDQIQYTASGEPYGVPAYRETLPNGVSYVTLDINPNGFADNTQEFIVPEGHYFMMGDNRDNSSDSRFAPNYQDPERGGVGYVPFENLIGRAEFIFFSVEDGTRPWMIWKWPTDVRWDRLFTGL